MMRQDPLLTVDGLSIDYRMRGRWNRFVDDVGFTIGEGHTTALVGESGSGKSSIANAVLRLLPSQGSRVHGSIDFRGTSTTGLSERRFRTLRQGNFGYVPQDPTSSLNPVRTVGVQLRESIALARRSRGSSDEYAGATELLHTVQLPDAERVLNAYPHELSGGMLQRVLIAIALASRPTLLVADEPTSALDVTVQKAILELFVNLREQQGISLLLITHDLGLARDIADDVTVLSGGRVAESGPTTAIFDAPSHPYTQRLLADIPALTPAKYKLGAVRETRPFIEVENVVKTFGERRALDGVSFTVAEGTTHALVGESGSGKTTVARILLKLEQPSDGTVRVDGRDTADVVDLRDYRRTVQLVYQNPFLSLDPRLSVEDAIAEPLHRFGIGDRTSRRRKVRDLLDQVRLDSRLARSYPRQLSGGQRQRVAIPRALAPTPRILVLDEATSALDVTIQSAILDLLVEVQNQNALTYVVISHDFGVVRQVADTITVMKSGVVVESGSTEAIFDSPQHEYTAALIEAIPGTRRLPVSAAR